MALALDPRIGASLGPTYAGQANKLSAVFYAPDGTVLLSGISFVERPAASGNYAAATATDSTWSGMVYYTWTGTPAIPFLAPDIISAPSVVVITTPAQNPQPGTSTPATPYTPLPLPTPPGPLIGGPLPRSYCTPQDVYGLFGAFARRIPLSTLLRNIQLATALFETLCNNRIIQSTTYTENLPLLLHRNELGVRVTAYPVISVTSLAIKRFQDTTFTPVGSPNLIDAARQPLRFVYYTGPEAFTYFYAYGQTRSLSYGAKGQVQITYTAGYARIPQEVVLAVASLTMEMMLRSLNPFGAASVSSSAEGASNSLSLGDISKNMEMAQKVIDKYTAWE